VSIDLNAARYSKIPQKPILFNEIIYAILKTLVETYEGIGFDMPSIGLFMADMTQRLRKLNKGEDFHV
jgi:hypothetical protein